MLYMMALTTGLRAGELASLSWRSLDLGKSEPSVTVLAAYAKNGKEATLPLRQDVAEEFRQWFSNEDFPPDSRVFPGFNKHDGAAILREDLEAAGIDYQDAAGRYVDFHALRHCFISLVGKTASIKETQSLARHSTVTLTLDTYSHIGLSDERQAVERLPELHRADHTNEAVAIKTGTDDRSVGGGQNGQENLTPNLTPFLTPTAFSGCNQSSAIGNGEGVVQGNALQIGENRNCKERGKLDNENDQLSTNDIDKNPTERGGFEPPVRQAYNGFRDRPDKPLRHLSDSSVSYLRSAAESTNCRTERPASPLLTGPTRPARHSSSRCVDRQSPAPSPALPAPLPSFPRSEAAVRLSSPVHPQSPPQSADPPTAAAPWPCAPDCWPRSPCSPAAPSLRPDLVPGPITR